LIDVNDVLAAVLSRSFGAKDEVDVEPRAASYPIRSELLSATDDLCCKVIAKMEDCTLVS
jgi:hypothetical protein